MPPEEGGRKGEIEGKRGEEGREGGGREKGRNEGKREEGKRDGVGVCDSLGVHLSWCRNPYQVSDSLAQLFNLLL